MITVEQALRIVLEKVKFLGHEQVPLARAFGRVLAEEVLADMNMPPFDRARMDGYAVRAADVSTTPTQLRVVGEIAAGSQFSGILGPGEAVKIFTGAPLPIGADAVQKVEVTSADGDQVQIDEPVKAGQFITPAGSEVRRGEVVVNRGRQIGPPEMSVLASFGHAQVQVGRSPRVGVISTGSELVDVSEQPAAAQIRNSNSYTIAAYAQAAGAIVENLGTIHDDIDATCDALLRAGEGRDVVITSGGVSMGDYDLVKAALVQLGAELFFEKVIIRPGKPTVFARRGDTYFFGLPGNPVSTSVTFNVFVRPALRKMQGEVSPALPSVKAVLLHTIKDGSSRRSYLPAKLSIVEGRAVARSLKWGGSSDLVGFMNANALIVVPEQVYELPEGAEAEVLVLDRVGDE